jgi:predicted anti-sigma-YlaC factor YlaD
MNGHVEMWLDAYLDDELQPAVRQQVETHLSACPSCRQALARRQGLSALLQSIPPAAGLKPAERFVAEVGLQLERLPLRGQYRRKSLQMAWQLIPVGLILTWLFLQVVFILSSLLEVIPGVGRALEGSVGAVPFHSYLYGLFPGALAGRLLGMFNWSWLDSLAGMIVICGLYCCWLLFSWAYARWHDKPGSPATLSENKEFTS